MEGRRASLAPTSAKEDPRYVLPAPRYDLRGLSRLGTVVKVVEQRVVLQGYQLYIVEQWLADREKKLISLSVFTGDERDALVGVVVEVEGGMDRMSALSEHELNPQSLTGPSADRASHERYLRQVMQELAHEGARIKMTEKGQLMVTSLSTCPPDLNVVFVPGGDYPAAIPDLYTNFNLRRIGCSGRNALTLQKPSDASADKFAQLYQLPPLDLSMLNHVVPETIKLIQSALVIYGLYDVNHVDGLLCNATCTAIQDWAVEIGGPFLELDSLDGPLDSRAVAGLLSSVLVLRTKFNVVKVPMPKDPLEDVQAVLTAITSFQRSQKHLEVSGHMDENTMAVLNQMSDRVKEGGGFRVHRRILNRLEGLAGFFGQQDLETTSIELFAKQTEYMPDRMKSLWSGRFTGSYEMSAPFGARLFRGLSQKVGQAGRMPKKTVVAGGRMVIGAASNLAPGAERAQMTAADKTNSASGPTDQNGETAGTNVKGGESRKSHDQLAPRGYVSAMGIADLGTATSFSKSQPNLSGHHHHTSARFGLNHLFRTNARSMVGALDIDPMGSEHKSALPDELTKRISLNRSATLPTAAAPRVILHQVDGGLTLTKESTMTENGEKTVVIGETGQIRESAIDTVPLLPVMENRKVLRRHSVGSPRELKDWPSESRMTIPMQQIDVQICGTFMDLKARKAHLEVTYNRLLGIQVVVDRLIESLNGRLKERQEKLEASEQDANTSLNKLRGLVQNVQKAETGTARLRYELAVIEDKFTDVEDFAGTLVSKLSAMNVLVERERQPHGLWAVWERLLSWTTSHSHWRKAAHTHHGNGLSERSSPPSPQADGLDPMQLLVSDRHTSIQGVPNEPEKQRILQLAEPDA